MTLHQQWWLADLAAYSFQAAIIVIVGSLLPALLRLRAPKPRLVYWQALLAACLLLPLVEPWRALAPLDAFTGQVSISMGAAAPVNRGWPLSFADAVAVVLLAGILFRAVWISLGLRRLRRLRKEAKRLFPMPEPFQKALSMIRAGVEVLVTSELASPATVGFRAPAVLLPESFFRLTVPEQTAIAYHELLHVARRDWLWNAAEEIVLAFLWFHPALWWIVRNIRLSREQTVDAEVVRRTQSRQAYLSALIEMARQNAGGLPAPLFLQESQLAERVALIVKEVSMSRLRLAAICLAAGIILAFAGSVAVWAFPLRAPTRPSSTVTIESSVGDRAQAGKAPHAVKVTQLRQVHIVTPHYPAEAKKAGIQGTVELEATLNKYGVITDLKLISGPPALVESAEDAVRHWRYAPSPLLPARTRIDIRYTLAERKPGAHASVIHTPGISTELALASGLRPVHIVDPVYPPLAKRARIQTNVVLRVTVDKAGNVSSVEPIAGHPLLIEAAEDAVRQWRFAPAAKAPVETTVTIPFRLPAETKPALVERSHSGGFGNKNVRAEYIVGPGIRAPVPVFSPDPPYTPEAHKAKLSGNVVLAVTVNPEGRVSRIKVEKPLGMGLDASAVKTVRTWRFKPAERDGKPVPVKVLIRVTFQTT